MRKAEQKVWDTMKRKAPKELWLQRIENIVGDGMTDVHSSHTTGREKWIELKAGKLPKRTTTPLQMLSLIHI